MLARTRRPGAIVPGHLHLSEFNFALEDGIIRVTTTSCYFKGAGGEDGVDIKGLILAISSVVWSAIISSLSEA